MKENGVKRGRKETKELRMKNNVKWKTLKLSANRRIKYYRLRRLREE